MLFEEVFIEFSGYEGQARMKRMKGEEVDNDFLYMLMPARLSAQDRIAEDEMNKEESSEDVPESENENYEQQAAPENPEGENNQQ